MWVWCNHMSTSSIEGKHLGCFSGRLSMIQSGWKKAFLMVASLLVKVLLIVSIGVHYTLFLFETLMLGCCGLECNGVHLFRLQPCLPLFESWRIPFIQMKCCICLSLSSVTTLYSAKMYGNHWNHPSWSIGVAKDVIGSSVNWRRWRLLAVKKVGGLRVVI